MNGECETAGLRDISLTQDLAATGATSLVPTFARAGELDLLLSFRADRANA